jgi:hypothetical protein
VRLAPAQAGQEEQVRADGEKHQADVALGHASAGALETIHVIEHVAPFLRLLP